MIDDYGNDYGFEEEDLGGLTVHNNLGDITGSPDAADDWLSQNSLGEGEDKSYADELYGAATAETIQLGRIGHLEYRTQAGIKELLTGNNLGMHQVDADAAREQFAEEIGYKDLSRFARQIRVDESVLPPTQEREINQIASILQNSSGTYMTRGAGGALAGHNVYGDSTEWQQEKQGKADANLLEAVGYVKEIAGAYLDDRTIGTTVEPARRRALEESITKRMIDGTFYEGSTSMLPLPNETGVTGIKPTQGIYGTFQGTAEDRLSSSQFDNLYQQVPSQGSKTRFVRDDRGNKVFREDVSKEQRNDALRRTPSLANSLFPKPRPIGKQVFTKEEKAKHTRDQNFKLTQLQTKANKARKILRQETITTRDESKGNELRMAGWDTPYGEQADLQSLRNEAVIQGEEWNSFYSGQKDDEYKQSSMNDLVRKMAGEEDEEEPLSFLEAASPAQGTQAWLNQRKGHITASTAAGLLKEGGIEARAEELALERMGNSESFTGNAHTREGNEGEAKAAAAFMASKHAKGLTMTEAFFETNENLKGFGVSPDGRLWNDEGDSAGLLELKYLSSGSMEGAVKKYTPQVQMQMAVTGESQTHFYALDKYTGEYVHELIKADPKMQADLISAGTKALELGASLDNRGIQALRRQRATQKKMKPRNQVGAVDETTIKGQQESIQLIDEVDEPMTAFQSAVMAGVDSSGSGPASITKLAKKLQQQDQASRMKQATEDAKDLPTSDLEFEQVQNRKDQAQARNAFVDGNARPAFGDATDLVSTEMASYYKAQEASAKSEQKLQSVSARDVTAKEAATRKMALTEIAAYAEDQKISDDSEKAAAKETADAAKEASSNLKEFGNSVRKASNILGELASVVMTGNKSGMDEVRLAAESGLDVSQVRGMREAMEMGGMDTSGINKTIGAASGLVTTFNDEASAASKFTDIMSSRGRSNIKAVRTMDMPSIQEFQQMNAQQLTTQVASMMQGQTPEAKTQIGQMFGMTSLATSDITPEMITTLDSSINEEGLRATSRGIKSVEQIKREVMEEAGELGEVTGQVSSGVATAAAVTGSATAGFVASKAARLMRAAKPNSMGASAIKNLSTAAKATPLALAASVAPMAVRHVAGIKDDGSVGDSLMDVAEFAGYGAAVGSVVPGVGTAIGAGVGALVGVANEAWDYFSADDAMPNADIGKMPMQGKEATKPTGTSVNVEVTNEISPDLVRTTTNVNGDLNIDEESGIGTGG